MAVEQDAWLEIANRDFSLFPAVRTLVAMCRQGILVGVGKKCKRAVELFYGPGDVMTKKVHRRGTGPKGNRTDEKKLIYEMVTLLLGHVGLVMAPRSLEHNTVRNLKITTKLDRSKLDARRFTTPDDTATRMLNSVEHVFQSVRVTKAMEAEGDIETPLIESLLENEDDEPREEQELEQLLEEQRNDVSNMIEAEMEAMVFDEEEDATEIEEPAVATKAKFRCLDDLERVGWDAIEKMGVQQIRQDAKARKKRKRRVTKYILDKVKEMKSEAAGIAVGTEKENPVQAPWCNFFHSMRSEFYV